MPRRSLARRLASGAAAALAALMTGTALAQNPIYAVEVVSRGSDLPVGTANSGIAACDDCTTPIALPFPFPFYGGVHNSAFITSNGVVNFLNAPASFSNQCLPTPSVAAPTIFGLWDDLTLGPAGSGVFTATEGAAPNRRFIIEWRAQYLSGTALDRTVNFSIVLFETTGDIEIVYRAAGTDGNTAAGASATVGIQAGAAGPATQFSCNEALVASGLRLRFSPVHPTIYQGRLDSDGQPFTGNADLSFRLFDAPAAGNTVGPAFPAPNTAVTNGLFTAALPLSQDLLTARRWVQVSVNGAPLAPRQPLAPAPLALPSLRGGGSIGTPLPLIIPPSDPVLLQNMLAFGQPGNGSATADNTDLIAFQRINTANDRSELRLFLGDNGGAPGAPTDAFVIGVRDASPTRLAPRFVFNSAGGAEKPGGGAWAVLSDPAAKHDAKPLAGTLDKLLTLRGYSFLYNDELVAAGAALPGEQAGLMADEVQRVFPDWVSTGPDGLRRVTERATTALMVEALRDLRAEKDAVAAQAQQARRDIDSLRSENAALRARLEALEQALRPAP